MTEDKGKKRMKKISATPQRRLVALMKAKQKLLGTHLQYFTMQDEMEIMLWDTELADRVVQTMIAVATRRLEERPTTPFWLDWDMCPFCVYSDINDFSCADSNPSKCRYGRYHGVCFSTHSTYMQLLNELGGLLVDELGVEGQKKLLAILEGNLDHLL